MTNERTYPKQTDESNGRRHRGDTSQAVSATGTSVLECTEAHGSSHERDQASPANRQEGENEMTNFNLDANALKQIGDALSKVFIVPGPRPAGMVSEGNIDIAHRPRVWNPQTKGYSSVWSMSIGTDKGEVLIPRVSDDGKILT